jgi:predicted nucleotidyltransferase
MIPALTHARQDELEMLCRRYGVTRLEVFGSATRGDFDKNKSDIDLIVHFRDEQAKGLFDRYWGLTEELEKIFGRPIELLTERMIRNPYFRATVDAERQTLYAGEPEETLG